MSVTPLLQDEDLRSLLQQGEEQLDQLVPLDVVDLSDDDSEDAEDGFALIDSDYTEEDNLIADLEIDAIIEDITATENILENIVTTTPSNSPQVGITLQRGMVTDNTFATHEKQINNEGEPITKYKQLTTTMIYPTN